MTTHNVVIAGAGQAGAWAARSLRDGGYDGTITIIGDEQHAPYERPPLSKEILLGDASANELTILDHDELSALNIESRLGLRVESIDRDGRSIKLSNGERLSYGALILCTGGRARRLEIDGLDDSHVHTLRTLDDALRLKTALTDKPGHLLVVGGGWIGLEVAASARALGCTVTVLESAERLCPRSVTPDVSEALLTLHTANQVRVLLSTQLAAATALDDGFRVSLSSGESVDCEHIVVAAGLIANDDLAKSAGLSCANGIVVDDQCRTSDPSIYAAGDVAILETSMPGVSMRLESWQNAQDQGMAVAASILQQDVCYRPTPMVWSQQFDQFIQIVGHSNAGTVAVERAAGNGRLTFYLDSESAVLGAVGMNAGRDFRFARQLVERGIRVSSEALADPSTPLRQLASSHATATQGAAV